MQAGPTGSGPLVGFAMGMVISVLELRAGHIRPLSVVAVALFSALALASIVTGSARAVWAYDRAIAAWVLCSGHGIVLVASAA